MDKQQMEKEIKRLNKLVCQQEIEYHQLLRTAKRVEKNYENLEWIVKVAINMAYDKDENEAIDFLTKQFTRHKI
jgi:hypothetical protein